MSDVSLRVIVFTDMPEVAAAYPQLLAAHGHRLVGVVTSRKRNPNVAGVVSNVPDTATVIVSDTPRYWASMLAPMQPDLIISTVFPWRIPQAVIDLPRLGAFNIHPSLLPKYRGTMTPNWTLLNGERQSGITAHRMVADFDAGPILAQAAFEVSDDDDLAAYMQALYTHAPAVVSAALQRVIAGDPGEPQDESQATYFGVMPETHRIIDWNSPARRVYNQVRAYAAMVEPPGAVGTIDEVPSRIFQARLLPTDTVAGIEPGTIIDRDGEGVTIQCADGPIKVLTYVPA